MEICTLASGSSGNCTLIRSGGSAVLVDAGVSLRRIVRSLAGLGLCPEDVDAVLVTHEHADHTAALGMIAKYTNIPILAPYGALRGLLSAQPEAEEAAAGFEAGEELVFGRMIVRSFRTPHDVPESVGYRFEDGKASCAVCTDLGCVPPEVLAACSGAGTVLLESNHDEEMLRCGPYPAALKRRILSDRGHLSNGASGAFAVSLAASGTRRFILGHLSRENNTPSLALRTVGAALSEAGCIPGRDVGLYAAPRSEPGEVFEC